MDGRPERRARLRPRPLVAAQVGEAPDHRADPPHDQLRISSRKGYPHPVPFRRKHPGIADIAIKSRLEINQHEADFLHLAAEMPAGQAVRELVDRDDGENHQPEENQAVQVEQALNDSQSKIFSASMEASFQ